MTKINMAPETTKSPSPVVAKEADKPDNSDHKMAPKVDSSPVAQK